MRKITEKQEPAWVVPEKRQKTGACLSRSGFWWFFGARNVKSEKIDSLGTGWKKEPAWGCWIFSAFIEICRNLDFYGFRENHRNSWNSPWDFWGSAVDLPWITDPKWAQNEPQHGSQKGAKTGPTKDPSESPKSSKNLIIRWVFELPASQKGVHFGPKWGHRLGL